MDPGPVCILTVLYAKGYAEHVRLALTVGGIAFEDRRVGYDEVARMRAAGELPFGQVQTRVALRDPPPQNPKIRPPTPGLFLHSVRGYTLGNSWRHCPPSWG